MLYEHQFQMDWRCSHKAWKYKIAGENLQALQDADINKDF